MIPSSILAQQKDDVYRSSADAIVQGASGLDITELIGEVLARHPSVRGSRYDSDAAEKFVDVARRQFYPTPTVTMEAGDSRPSTVFRLTQPLWTGGQLTGQLRVAELRRERAALVGDEVRIRLALRVLDLCQSYWSNSQRVKTMQWTVQTLAQLTDMIKRRTEAEVSSLADLRVAEARVAQAQADLQGFLVARRQAQDQLAQLLGLSVDLGALNWRTSEGDSRGLRDYLAAAVADWPANRVARVDEMIARQEVVVAKAAQWPVVSLSLERRSTGLYDTNRLLLSAQYTPGAGLSALSQADASQLRAYSAAQAMETAERLSADAIVMEWESLQSAVSRKLAQAAAFEGARDVLASNRRLFVAGRRSWLDVVNSVREVTQAEISQAEIETVVVASRIRLALLAGQQVWIASVGVP